MRYFYSGERLSEKGNNTMLYKENKFTKEESVKMTRELCSVENILNTTFKEILGKDYRGVSRDKMPKVVYYAEKMTEENINESKKLGALKGIYEKV
jgi:hypothetical protein